MQIFVLNRDYYQAFMVSIILSVLLIIDSRVSLIKSQSIYILDLTVLYQETMSFSE